MVLVLVISAVGCDLFITREVSEEEMLTAFQLVNQVTIDKAAAISYYEFRAVPAAVEGLTVTDKQVSGSITTYSITLDAYSLPKPSNSSLDFDEVVASGSLTYIEDSSDDTQQYDFSLEFTIDDGVPFDMHMVIDRDEDGSPVLTFSTVEFEDQSLTHDQFYTLLT